MGLCLYILDHIKNTRPKIETTRNTATKIILHLKPLQFGGGGEGGTGVGLKRIVPLAVPKILTLFGITELIF